MRVAKKDTYVINIYINPECKLCYIWLGQVRFGSVRLGWVRLGQDRLGDVRLRQAIKKFSFQGRVMRVAKKDTYDMKTQLPIS